MGKLPTNSCPVPRRDSCPCCGIFWRVAAADGLHICGTISCVQLEAPHYVCMAAGSSLIAALWINLASTYLGRSFSLEQDMSLHFACSPKVNFHSFVGEHYSCSALK